MKNLSIKKLGGFCLIIGSLLSFIPFFLQITLGGTPEEGTQIFSFFANEVLNGNNSLLYPLLSSMGITFTIFGIYSLNSVLQKEKENALLSLGTFFIIIGSIGYLFAWSIDYFIIWSDPLVATNSYTLKMGLIILFGGINWGGVQTYASAISIGKYINSSVSGITSAVAGLIVVIHVYTIFTLDPNSTNTIMPLFIGLSVGQLIFTIFNITLARKMITS